MTTQLTGVAARVVVGNWAGRDWGTFSLKMLKTVHDIFVFFVNKHVYIECN